MLGTSVFAAETVVFEESFELEPIDGLYVSMPEIRVYSSETALITTGTFESGEKESNAFLKNNNIVVDANGAHTDNYGLLFKTAANLQIYAYSDRLEDGVYEFEAYVKSEKPYSVSMGVNQTTFSKFMATADASDSTVGGGAAEHGHAAGRAVASSDWQRVSARYVFTKSPKGMLSSTGTLFDDSESVYPQFHITVAAGAAGAYDGNAPLYVDDIKLRKVENAVPSNNPRQKGMPTYPIDALSGKQNAQVVMDVKNQTTTGSKHLTLITAYYNEDGSLHSVLNVYNTDVAKSDAVQHIESNTFDIPTIADGGEIKTFVWDGASSLFPYTDQADSSFTTSHIFTEGTEAEGYTFDSTPIPGSDNVYSYGDLNRGETTVNGVAHYTNQVYTGTALSGVRSLYIPSILVRDNDTVTASGVNFPVKANTKYKLEFWVLGENKRLVNFRIGGEADEGNINGGNMPTQTWSSNDITSYANSAEANRIEKGTTDDGTATLIFKNGIAANHTKYFARPDASSAIGKWTKITCEFTTPAELTKEFMSLSLIPDADVCKENSARNGAWIDDIVVYEITE